MKQFYLVLLLFTVSTFLYAQSDTLQLKEVEIIEEQIDTKHYPTERLTKIEIRQKAVRDIGDLLRGTNNINGVRKGPAVIDPVVRGFKYSQLNVQINGGSKIEGGCPNRMDPATAHVDVDDLKVVEVLKGPFALRYGSNFGGVINLKTVAPESYEKFTINLTALKGFESNWNGNKEHITLTGGNKNFFFNLSAHHKKYGNYKDGNDNEVSSEFRKYGLEANLGYTFYKNHQIMLSYTESYGRDMAFPALPMDERNDDTRIVAVDYSGHKLFGANNKLVVKAYQSDVNHEMDNKNRPFSDTVVAISAIETRNRGYRAEYFQFFENSQFILGTDHENISKDGNRKKHMIMQPVLPVKTESLWNNASINNYGFFAEYSKRLNKLEVVAATRIDINNAGSGKLFMKNMQGEVLYQNDNTSSDFTNFSFSVSGKYAINKKMDISLALGRGVRSPDMTERFIILLPIGYDRYDYLGNPELKPETNYEADLGLNIISKLGCNIGINTFFSYVQDYITGQRIPPSEIKPQTKGVLGVKEFYNADHVYLYGYEISFSSPASKKWGVSIISGMTRGINPETKVYKYENGEVVGEEIVTNDPLSEIPPLEATLGTNYKFFKGKLVPELSLRMVSKQTHISQAYNEVETPGFMLLNFSFRAEYNKYFHLTGGVSNILDKAYYEHLNRNIVGSSYPLYEPGRLFYINLLFNI